MSNREPNGFIFVDETPPRAPRTPVNRLIPLRTPTNSSITLQSPFTPPATPPTTPHRQSTPNVSATPESGRTIKSFNLQYKTMLLTSWMVDTAYSTGARLSK